MSGRKSFGVGRRLCTSAVGLPVSAWGKLTYLDVVARTRSSGRGIITHLLNSLGMLANHHVIAVDSEASGLVGWRRADGGTGRLSRVCGPELTENLEVNGCT